MEQFKEIIDTYIENYSKFEKGKVSFDCEYGELIFFKDNSNILILFGIYIFPEQRNKGFCREILHYLIEQCANKFKCICVQSVISKILYQYLLRFRYNNKKFKNTKTGFVYVIKN
jgi:RimJ/RimL family protein N-acetyltransferase